MTYSLLEFAKESVEDIVVLPEQADLETVRPALTTEPATQPPQKKEVLSKQAKRKLAGRTSES